VLLVSVVILIIVAGITTTAILLTRSENFQLSIIHLNDFHARFEETSLTSTACKSDDCIGGFSRVYTAVHELLSDRPNSIFLNAGDNFQGTLWYNIFRWNVTQYFLNMLPTDATTLGNHEFDNKIEGVVPFLENLESPVVVSNIDDSLEPTIQGLYNKSIIIERDGRSIGVVGVILSTTNQLSSTENLRFLDESESVNKEAERLLKEENVFTVIVLSHCGFDVDQLIAAKASKGITVIVGSHSHTLLYTDDVDQLIAAKAIPGITVIVGSHSHTLLYTGTPPDGTAYGEYPTVINNIAGDPVLIVQASAYTKYLGNLSVEYDGHGNLLSWEGNPIYLDRSIPQDPNINDLLEPYRIEVESYGDKVLGKSKVFLQQSNCRYAECNLGNLLTDAMVAYYASESDENWTKAAIAVMNAGGIRTAINKGGN
ncbi:Calcineurin-like phosphoesterase, partial [Oryctes borbonicus]